MDAQERAVEVRGYDVVPALHVYLGEGAARYVEARVVDQDIDPPEGVQSALDHTPDRGWYRHVAYRAALPPGPSTCARIDA